MFWRKWGHPWSEHPVNVPTKRRSKSSLTRSFPCSFCISGAAPQHHSTTARPSALAEPPLTEVDWEFYLQSEHKCIWVREHISGTLLGIIRQICDHTREMAKHHYSSRSPVWGWLCHHCTFFKAFIVWINFSPPGHTRVVLRQVGMLPLVHSSYAHLSRTLDM